MKKCLFALGALCSCFVACAQYPNYEPPIIFSRPVKQLTTQTVFRKIYNGYAHLYSTDTFISLKVDWKKNKPVSAVMIKRDKDTSYTITYSKPFKMPYNDLRYDGRLAAIPKVPDWEFQEELHEIKLKGTHYKTWKIEKNLDNKNRVSKILTTELINGNWIFARTESMFYGANNELSAYYDSSIINNQWQLTNGFRCEFRYDDHKYIVRGSKFSYNPLSASWDEYVYKFHYNDFGLAYYTGTFMPTGAKDSVLTVWKKFSLPFTLNSMNPFIPGQKSFIGSVTKYYRSAPQSQWERKSRTFYKYDDDQKVKLITKNAFDYDYTYYSSGNVSRRLVSYIFGSTCEGGDYDPFANTYNQDGDLIYFEGADRKMLYTYTEPEPEPEIKPAPLNEFMLYPNPVSNTLHISLVASDKPSQILICNLAGQVIMNETIQNNASFDVSEWTKGVYILFVDTNGIRQHRKFVKM